MSDMHTWPLRRYDFPMPIRHYLYGPSDQPVVICLHGYQDHALSMLRRLGWWEQDLPFQVLAVNGPFPVPIWTKVGFTEAYSWYFRDTARNLDFVSPQITAQRLSELLRDLGLEGARKVIFGFSQGGYLAPYLAAKVDACLGIIGYGCDYITDVYSQCAPLRVHAVHGQLDERISLASSQENFSRLSALGHRGEFHVIPDLTHKVDTVAEPLVRRLVEECLK